jgi:hypothetical protein
MRDESLDLKIASDSMDLLEGLTQICTEVQTATTDNRTLASKVDEYYQKLKLFTAAVGGAHEKIAWDFFTQLVNILLLHIKVLNALNDEGVQIIVLKEKISTFANEICQNPPLNLLQGFDIHKIFSADKRDVMLPALLNLLKTMPLPIAYWKFEESEFPGRSIQNSEKPSGPKISVMRIIAFLDSNPIATPIILQTGLNYTLELRIRGIDWPENAIAIRISFLTSLASAEYTFSEFTLRRPSVSESLVFEDSIKGHIRFNSAQSISADNYEFSLNCTYLTATDDEIEMKLIGQTRLSFQVVSKENRIINSGYKTIDQHINEIVEKLRRESVALGDEIHSAIPLLQALTNILASYSQSAVFKTTTKLSESDFQKHILLELRRTLGESITEGSKIAGGKIDLKYNSKVIELKVEHKNGDRKFLCEQYTKQPTQYQGVEAQQVSIVLVLDLTPKENPPGDIRNDIILVDVPTHGGAGTDKKYPSKAILFVINGNLKNPSDYSQ